jgi:uncharacterized protein (TIGR02246 family)
MKIRSLLALVGLAIGFALPTYAQQKDPADPPIVQQRDLLGVAEAIGEFGDLHRKLDEAYDKNDAAAVAALFTEDGLFVTPDEMFSGRQQIETRHADMFQRSPIVDFNCSRERRHLVQSTTRFGRLDNGLALLKARLVRYLRGALGQRFTFVRVMLGSSAC